MPPCSPRRSSSGRLLASRSRSRWPSVRSSWPRRRRPRQTRPRAQGRSGWSWVSRLPARMSTRANNRLRLRFVAVDVIVAGLGAHGSAAAYHLAKRGASVLGLERFARGHTLGSSGGLSRIIRLAYYEHPDYVPLLRRAWDLWRELERSSGETLLTQTGGLYAGAPAGELMSGSLASARTHRLAHEVLDAAALRRRFPLFEWPDGWIGLHEEQAGWLASERAIETHLREAERHGATLRFAEPVERWEPTNDGVRVTTAAGGYDAQRLVIAAGAWLGRP